MFSVQIHPSYNLLKSIHLFTIIKNSTLKTDLASLVCMLNEFILGVGQVVTLY